MKTTLFLRSHSGSTIKRRGMFLSAALLAGMLIGILAASVSSALAATRVSAPSSLALPTLSGIAREGATLTADPGVWGGDVPITFSYGWEKCDSSGSGCGPVRGANGASYLLPNTAPGTMLRVVVTASNAAGSTVARSFLSGVVAPAGKSPANADLPVVKGTVQQGQTMSATPGVWNGTLPMRFGYQWQRCTATGSACAAIAGAASPAYTLTAADTGATVRVAITASNSYGINKAFSGPTRLIASASSPAVSTLPAISGTAKEGQALSVATGAWSGTKPIAFTFSWLRCDLSGGSCTPILGATTSTFTPGSTEVGHTLRVLVTASNAAGGADALTEASDVVASNNVNAPANSTAPAITGTADVGAKLTATTGTWTGSTPLTFAYLWQSCDASGNNCTPIAGANSPSYSTTSVNVGHKLRVQVVASNSFGATSALSAATGPVAYKAPYNIAAPVIYASSTTLKEGDVVTASTGSWLGEPTISFTYQWNRCSVYPSCSPIPLAKRVSYTITKADVGHPIFVQIKADNHSGDAFVNSQPTPAGISLQLRLAAPPTITGAPVLGSTLTAHPGTWVGAQPVSYTYQWTRCATSGAACSPIAGAKRATYTIAAADVGHPLFVQIKAITRQAYAFANSSRLTPTASGTGASTAVQVGSVVLPNRLVISGVNFQPSSITSHAPFIGRFRVTDATGRPVQGALVYALGLPYSWMNSSPEVATGADGWATIVINPTTQLPLSRGTSLVMFVRARKAGDNLLAGVSSRRLVQIVVGSRGVASATQSNLTAAPFNNAATPISALSLPDRLVISTVKFQPTSISSHASFIGRFRVTDTKGQPVQGALVYALGLPYSWMNGSPEVATDADGWATILITPTAQLPLTHGTSLVMFLRARKPGENILGGISNRRLVQIVVK